jgi:hypothetical protein
MHISQIPNKRNVQQNMKTERRGRLLPNSRLFLDLDLFALYCCRATPPLFVFVFLLLAIALLSHPGQRKCRRKIELDKVLKANNRHQLVGKRCRVSFRLFPLTCPAASTFILSVRQRLASRRPLG